MRNCESCGLPAARKGTKADGTVKYRRYCYQCDWEILGRRRGPQVRHTPKKSYPSGLKKYTKYKGTKCELCGFVPIHKCQLDVDHKNGNHKDNRPENLQTLCANCHRLKTLLCKEGIYKD